MLRSCSSPFEVEVRGVAAGLELARELNLKGVDIVTDSVEAVWFFCSGGGGGMQVVGESYAAVLPLLQHHDWTVRHVFREWNKIADELAKSAMRFKWEWSSLDAIPFRVAGLRIMSPLDSCLTQDVGCDAGVYSLC